MPVRLLTLLVSLMLFCCAAFAAPKYGSPPPCPAAAVARTERPVCITNTGPKAGHASSILQTEKKAVTAFAEDHEAEHQEWEVESSGRTFWLGVLMALIATCQLVLFGFQLRMMRRNIFDTTNAARAAELNAKAAIGIELPFLRAIPPELLGMAEPIPEEGPYGGYVNDGPPVAYNALGSIEIDNLGRTPAYSLALSFGWAVARVLPETPPDFQQIIRMNHNLVLAAGEETDCHLDVCITLSREEIKDAADDKKWLWIFGEIEYRDFMDQLQAARFCWRFANRNPPGDLKLYYLASDGDPPAAYTRRTAVINI